MARMRYGVHKELEEVADELLRRSLIGVTKYSDKSDLLTPWKLKNRAQREVLTNSGSPESAIRQGMFHRAANMTRPDLNSRDGIAQSRSRGLNIVQTQIQEFGDYSEEWS